MAINNQIQFAVVREDPLIDIEIIKKFKLRNGLLVASGGCTALSVASQKIDFNLTLFDPNQAQLDLIKEKVKFLSSNFQKKKFNITSSDPKSLNACGNFESLFRGFRFFIWDLIASEDSWVSFFSGEKKEGFLRTVFKNKYWLVAFDLFFHTNLLEKMFGQEAIQHAPKNSYSRYFQNLLESGLKREDVSENYFLHHIFLGYYFDKQECLPPYLANPNFEFQSEFINGYLSNIKEIESYDYIMLSNIFDWMDLKSVKEHCRILSKMKKGSILVLRQLNSSLDLQSFLNETFFFHESLAKDFLKKDRSLFYEKLVIAEKT